MITEADSPAAEPKNSSRAGTKSPELIPWRYISGSTSATFGDFRAHGGRIERPEPHPLPGHLVDPAVVHPWGPDLDRARSGDQRPGIGVPVADHQTVALFVPLVGQADQVGVDLGLEGSGQHPPGPFGDQFVQGGLQLRARGLLNMYSQHWRSFLAGVPPPAFL